MFALTVAAGSAWVASQNLVNAQKMSAYQLLASPLASPTAKWKAAAAVLTFDESVSGLDTGCSDDNCAFVFDFNLRADSGKEFVIQHVQASFVSFYSGVFDRVIFLDGAMIKSNFVLTELPDVWFRRVDLQFAQFRGVGREDISELTATLNGGAEMSAPGSFGLKFAEVDLSGALIDAPAASRLLVVQSDISDAEFKGDFAIVPNRNWTANFYRDGHVPLLNGEPAPWLADFVCPEGVPLSQLRKFHLSDTCDPQPQKRQGATN